MSNNRKRLLMILELFYKKTDENNHLTVKQIISILQNNGIHADRRSVYDDIEILSSMESMDIIRIKTKTYEYYLGSRLFELAELKLLVDAVQASRFITEKKSRSLIKKIELLSSENEALLLDRQDNTINRVKTMNEKVIYNIDRIHEAIAQKFKIKFNYHEYTINKELKCKRNGVKYEVSPYRLVWYNDNYYLVGYYECYQKVVNFRVDKMANIDIQSNPIVIDRSIILDDYIDKIFGMYSGDDEHVIVEFDNDLIGVVIDRFGPDIVIYNKTENSFQVRLHVSVSDVFLSWVFQFGKRARIVGPDVTVERMIQLVSDVGSLYLYHQEDK